MRLSGLDMLLRAGAGVFSKRCYAPVWKSLSQSYWFSDAKGVFLYYYAPS